MLLALRLNDLSMSTRPQHLCVSQVGGLIVVQGQAELALVGSQVVPHEIRVLGEYYPYVWCRKCRSWKFFLNSSEHQNNVVLNIFYCWFDWAPWPGQWSLQPKQPTSPSSPWQKTVPDENFEWDSKDLSAMPWVAAPPPPVLAPGLFWKSILGLRTQASAKWNLMCVSLF